MCKISHQLSACHQLRFAYEISAQFRHGYTTDTPHPPPGPLIQASLKTQSYNNEITANTV